MLTRLSERLGSPREWSLADRVVLLALCILPIMISYAIVGQYAIDHPERAPFMNRAFVRNVALWLQVRVFIPAWSIALAAAVFLRWRRPSSGVLIYPLSLLWFGWFGVCAYFFGSHTSLFSCFVLLGGVACGLTLFDRRPVFVGVVLFFVIITGTTVAEQLRLLPYAPILLEAPYRYQRLATWWLLTIGTIDFLAVAMIVLLIDYIVARWKRDESQLARTSEQLARANDVISRYVASQLAQRILAGDYGDVERHARRRLTLFFSDIKEFATIADQMEPEDLSEMLNEYLSAMVAIGEGYGGTIDKFIGDAIMIFFGAPIPLDDEEQARRAVRMAIEMQDRLAELRAKWVRKGFEQFHIRIGINTGQVSIGNFGSKGRMDYTAIGRQVNLAARLQSACEPGKILISHATWVLVQDEIPCIPKGEIQVKGFHAPVRVYEVMAPVTESAVPQARTTLSP